MILWLPVVCSAQWWHLLNKQATAAFSLQRAIKLRQADTAICEHVRRLETWTSFQQRLSQQKLHSNLFMEQLRYTTSHDNESLQHAREQDGKLIQAKIPCCRLRQGCSTQAHWPNVSYWRFENGKQAIKNDLHLCRDNLNQQAYSHAASCVKTLVRTETKLCTSLIMCMHYLIFMLDANKRSSVLLNNARIWICQFASMYCCEFVSSIMKTNKSRLRSQLADAHLYNAYCYFTSKAIFVNSGPIETCPRQRFFRELTSYACFRKC